MSERPSLGLPWIALAAVACCIGLPVLATAGAIAYLGIAGTGLVVIARRRSSFET